jgi:hypothetical protein
MDRDSLSNCRTNTVFFPTNTLIAMPDLSLFVTSAIYRPELKRITQKKNNNNKVRTLTLGILMVNFKSRSTFTKTSNAI